MTFLILWISSGIIFSLYTVGMYKFFSEDEALETALNGWVISVQLILGPLLWLWFAWELIKIKIKPEV